MYPRGARPRQVPQRPGFGGEYFRDDDGGHDPGAPWRGAEPADHGGDEAQGDWRQRLGLRVGAAPAQQVDAKETEKLRSMLRIGAVPATGDTPPPPPAGDQPPESTTAAAPSVPQVPRGVPQLPAGCKAEPPELTPELMERARQKLESAKLDTTEDRVREMAASLAGITSPPRNRGPQAPQQQFLPPQAVQSVQAAHPQYITQQQPFTVMQPSYGFVAAQPQFYAMTPFVHHAVPVQAARAHSPTLDQSRAPAVPPQHKPEAAQEHANGAATQATEGQTLPTVSAAGGAAPSLAARRTGAQQYVSVLPLNTTHVAAGPLAGRSSPPAVVSSPEAGRNSPVQVIARVTRGQDGRCTVDSATFTPTQQQRSPMHHGGGAARPLFQFGRPPPAPLPPVGDTLGLAKYLFNLLWQRGNIRTADDLANRRQDVRLAVERFVSEQVQNAGEEWPGWKDTDVVGQVLHYLILLYQERDREAQGQQADARGAEAPRDGDAKLLLVKTVPQQQQQQQQQQVPPLDNAAAWAHILKAQLLKCNPTLTVSEFQQIQSLREQAEQWINAQLKSGPRLTVEQLDAILAQLPVLIRADGPEQRALRAQGQFLRQQGVTAQPPLGQQGAVLMPLRSDNLRLHQQILQGQPPPAPCPPQQQQQQQQQQQPAPGEQQSPQRRSSPSRTPPPRQSPPRPTEASLSVSQPPALVCTPDRSLANASEQRGARGEGVASPLSEVPLEYFPSPGRPQQERTPRRPPPPRVGGRAALSRDYVRSCSFDDIIDLLHTAPR